MSVPKLITALGSSFAAGPGIEPVVDKTAMRSAANYAHLVSDRFGADLVDLSVSGATTSTILDTSQRMGTTRFAPQLAGLPAASDLVTITVGGNDLKFAGSMLATALATRMRGRVLTRPLGALIGRNGIPTSTPNDIANAASGLSRIVDAVRAKAPDARVLLVDYLTVIGADAALDGDLPFSASQIAQLAAIQNALQEAFRRAAAGTAAELVAVSMLSAAHGLGSAEPWVFGFRPGLRNLGSSFHPNPAGMHAVADEIIRVIST